MNETLFGSGFSARRVKQARELMRLTQTELASKVGVSQGAIGQVEGNFKSPSADLIRKIAEHSKRFESSFFHNDPPIELSPDSVMFRAKASMTRAEENEARRYTEVVCEMAAMLLRHIKPLPFRLAEVDSSNPVEAARQTRSVLEIPRDEPVPHLLSQIEKSGVLVVGLPTDLDGRDALSVWVEALKLPVIALSRKRPGDRLRLSSAHEWGHIVLKHSRRLQVAEERDAYRFGAELLMPEAAMRREITTPVTLSELARLKRRWRVSLQALIHRGEDLGIVSHLQAADLYTQLSAKGWKKQEPGELPVEKPRLVRQLAERVFGGNYGSLANELGFRREFVEEILDCYEGPQGAERLNTKLVALKRHHVS